MAFTLYTLLKDKSYGIEINNLKGELDSLFSTDPSYSSKLEAIPFKKNFCIKLSWPNWFFKVYLKEGEEALLDSEYISNESGDISIKEAKERIKTVFHGDRDGNFVNDCIILQEYLISIPNSSTYDIQKKSFLKK